MAGRPGATSSRSSAEVSVAPSSRATGISMTAGTKRSAGPVPSPSTLARCPLPSHDLRNGRLNQTAYSLFLFIRDLADGDLIGWIDRQLQAANSPPGPDRLTRMRAASLSRCGRSTVSRTRSSPWPCPASCSALRKRWPLDRGRRQHDRHRHAGSQLSAPDRHPASVQREPPVWRWLATGPAAAPTLFKPSPSRSMPGSSIQRFRRPFPGSSSTRSGSTAARAASMFATAIGLMMPVAARTRIAECA